MVSFNAEYFTSQIIKFRLSNISSVSCLSNLPTSHCVTENNESLKRECKHIVIRFHTSHNAACGRTSLQRYGRRPLIFQFCFTLRKNILHITKAWDNGVLLTIWKFLIKLPLNVVGTYVHLKPKFCLKIMSSKFKKLINWTQYVKENRFFLVWWICLSQIWCVF